MSHKVNDAVAVQKSFSSEVRVCCVEFVDDDGNAYGRPVSSLQDVTDGKKVGEYRRGWFGWRLVHLHDLEAKPMTVKYREAK